MNMFELLHRIDVMTALGGLVRDSKNAYYREADHYLSLLPTTGISMTNIVGEIKTLIKKGDSDAGRAEKYYKAAGQRLIKLRDGKTKTEFEKIVREQCDLGIVRAYFYIKLAKGKTTLTRDRAASAKSKRKQRAAATKKRSGRPEQPDPEELPGDSPQQRWQYSAANMAGMAGEAISLLAFWDKTFGEEWRSFEVPSDLVTLAQQAADAWAQIADELTTRAGAIPIRKAASHG